MAEATPSTFVFIGSRICKLSFTNPYISLPTGAKRTLAIDYTVNDVAPNDDGFHGIITLSVVLSIKQSRKKSVLKLEIEGCFDSKGINEESSFSEMLQINGATMLYSIARSIIQTVTSQSYLDESVALPMINMVSLYESKQRERKL